MAILNRIKRNEGFRQHPYKCPAGKLTIGYGRNLEARGISEAEATFLLENDIREAEEDLGRIFQQNPQGISLNRWEALVDMRFQLGAAGFRGFRRMIEAILEEDWETAAIECLDSDYARQTPNRAIENAELLRNG